MDALIELSWRTYQAALLMAGFVALTLLTMALVRVATQERHPPERKQDQQDAGGPPERPD